MNKYLREIYFESNEIIDIEGNVFINTNLIVLKLGENMLKDTKFAATFPPTLSEIHLDSNGIAEMFPGSFSKVNKLEFLELINYNNLCHLTLSDNPFNKLEKGALDGLGKDEGCYVFLSGVPIEMRSFLFCSFVRK